MRSFPIALFVLALASTPALAEDTQPSSPAAPAPAPVEAPKPPSVEAVLTNAIRLGAPLYNEGDVAGCLDLYARSAQALLEREARDVGEVHQMRLRAVTTTKHDTASAKAWAFREAFDRILSDMEFRPRMEASQPPGFPAPGPVGRVVEKSYPQYRAARASGRGMGFWTLFNHIKRNKVEMTAPVEETMDDSMRAKDMAFLYERPDQGSTGQQGRVQVVDLKPLRVMSIGMRGPVTRSALMMARKALTQRIEAEGLERAGDFRRMGYNSPMVRGLSRFWELQVPVKEKAVVTQPPAPATK